MSKNLLYAEAKTRPKTKWAIQGVLGGTALIWGEPGSFKTFLGISMAVAVASGRPWYGCRVAQGSVLYILGEGGIDMICRRVDAAARVLGADTKDLEFYIRPEAVKMVDADHLKDEWSEWDLINPRLVVIDTVSRCLPGDENKQEVMRGFVECMDTIRTRYDATVLAIHHASKEGTERGSTVLPGAVDVNLHIERYREKKRLTNKIRLAPEKLRDLSTEDFQNPTLVGETVECMVNATTPELDEFGDKVTTLCLKPDYDPTGDIDTATVAFAEMVAERREFELVGYKEWFERCKLDTKKFKRALNYILSDKDKYGILQFSVGQYMYKHTVPLCAGENYDTIIDEEEIEDDLWKYENHEFYYGED